MDPPQNHPGCEISADIDGMNCMQTDLERKGVAAVLLDSFSALRV